MKTGKIEERISQLMTELGGLKDWEDRYKKLIEWGGKLPAYPEEFRQDKFQVKGCQSQVWLYPEKKEGKIYFHADSDAILVKGIVALLLHVYSGSTPTEILTTGSDFLKDLGITQHLSMNRSNGLAAMFKQIQLYALVYQNMKD